MDITGPLLLWREFGAMFEERISTWSLPSPDREWDVFQLWVWEYGCYGDGKHQNILNLEKIYVYLTMGMLVLIFFILFFQ